MNAVLVWAEFAHLLHHQASLGRSSGEGQGQVMETERGGSGVNSTGYSTFSALSFKATAWLRIRADPAPGQPALGRIALGVLAMPPLVFGDGERKKVSAFPLWGILKNDNTGVTTLVY